MAALETPWTGERACSVGETNELITYLQRTPVFVLAEQLELGLLGASHATITGRSQLGSLQTIFGNLGGIHALAQTGRPKFLVSEVYETLHRQDCDAPDDRRRLDDLVEAEREGRLTDRRITVLADSNGPMIVDGNKRVAAIYVTWSDRLGPPAIFVLRRV